MAPPDQTSSDGTPADTGAGRLLPWESDGARAPFRTFWKTVFRVTALKGRLNEYLDGPSNRKIARSFRTVVVWLTFLSMLSASLILAGAQTASLQIEAFWQRMGGILAGSVGLLFSLFFLTGSVAWFCRPKPLPEDKQERAISLSYYASAPLVFSVQLPALACLLLIPAVREHTRVVGLVLGLIGLAGLLAYFCIALRAVHSLSCGNRANTLAAAILLPILWVVVPALVLLIPFLVAIWVLLIATVR